MDPRTNICRRCHNPVERKHHFCRRCGLAFSEGWWIFQRGDTWIIPIAIALSAFTIFVLRR